MNTTLQNFQQYGFLGPIVGIAGLLIGAGTAILFGWTRTLDEWKPPSDVMPDPLSRMVTMLCAAAIFIAWLMAEPANQSTYLDWVIRLAIGAVVAFLLYVGLRVFCGRFRKPLVDANNNPAGDEVIWGGLWLTPRARQAVRAGDTVEAFLAGNEYKREEVWTALSLTASAMVTSLVLLIALVCGTATISTAATAGQVALTQRPAREVFNSNDVPGLPPSDSVP